MFEIKRNCGGCDVSARNLVGQLDASGHTWKAYFEELDSSRRPGQTTQGYNPHYNPFVYYESVRGVPRDRARVVNFDGLRGDLNRGRLADFVWIAPGVRHDGHNGSLREADRYASRLVPRVLHALGPGGVLYLTWDEGLRQDRRGAGASGGGRIALIAAGGAARQHTRTSVRANHYALLRTIEAGFGLRALGEAGASSTRLLRELLAVGPGSGSPTLSQRGCSPSQRGCIGRSEHPQTTTRSLHGALLPSVALGPTQPKEKR